MKRLLFELTRPVIATTFLLLGLIPVKSESVEPEIPVLQWRTNVIKELLLAESSSSNSSEDQGQPTGTAPAGSLPVCPDIKPRFNVLVPVEKQPDDLEFRGANTTKAHPTFWIHIPYKSEEITSGEFWLQNREGKTIYKTSVQVNKTPGILKIPVPTDQPALKKGKWYEMHFSIEVDCNSASRPGTETVQAWVKREELNPVISSLLKQKTPQQQAMLYAKNNFWYDALMILAEHRCANPKDNSWNELLKEKGLEEYVNKPIVSCSTRRN
ncbi:MAG: DUF928 domain-containing protein [Cyanobacteria bacterium J06629_18]